MSDGAAWVGFATPLNDTDAARNYWCGGDPVRDICGVVNPAYFSKIAGPAVLDLRCTDCGKAKIVSSRSEASTYGPRDKGRYRCHPCRRDHSIRQLRERAAISRSKQEREEELRWMPYRDYLGTDDWSERRKKVIRRADFKCQVCASGGRLHVHHRTYARRGSERMEDMIALCADCHELFHAHGKLAENGRAA